MENIRIEFDDDAIRKVAQEVFDNCLDNKGVDYRCPECGSLLILKTGKNLCQDCGLVITVEKGKLEH